MEELLQNEINRQGKVLQTVIYMAISTTHSHTCLYMDIYYSVYVSGVNLITDNTAEIAGADAVCICVYHIWEGCVKMSQLLACNPV